MLSQGRTIAHRVFADFLMPSRLDLYRQLLEQFQCAGYRIVSIESMADLVAGRGVDGDQRYLILRHDIDTDAGTARRMFEIERQIGAAGSYFFRLSTLDVALMQEIAYAGANASYHYEEIATIAKRRRLRTTDEARACLPEARALFLRNVEALRRRTGLPMDVVASHGDFVNRRLGIPNWELLSDEAFRDEAAIRLETYDEIAMRPVDSRFNDTLYPRYWVPGHPVGAISQGVRVIYLLVHPRHWCVARVVNARDDANRIVEAMRYRLPIGAASGRTSS